MSNVTKLDDHRPNERRCYLVAHVDTSVRPPKILGTGLYSESAASLTGAIGHGRFAFDVTYADGPTYESARDSILAMPEPWVSAFRWAIDMLPDGERGR